MKLKTCPACGSTSIEANTLLGIAGNGYLCKSCGYSGEIIIEQDIDKQVKK
jgi:predicted RNA-binding Zn-ribbon protein involved in translation (DUF1610 family)